MAKKPLVDKNYQLCMGCSEIWFLKGQGNYACEKCLIKFTLHDAKQMIELAYKCLQDIQIGITKRPMIERE